MDQAHRANEEGNQSTGQKKKGTNVTDEGIVAGSAGIGKLISSLRDALIEFCNTAVVENMQPGALGTRDSGVVTARMTGFFGTQNLVGSILHDRQRQAECWSCASSLKVCEELIEGLGHG